MGGFLDERVEKELSRTFQGRVNFFQIRFVAGELVVFPEVLQEPRAAHRPQAPLRSVNRRGGAPQIRVVVDHPAARVIHDLAVRAPVCVKSSTIAVSGWTHSLRLPGSAGQ